MFKVAISPGHGMTTKRGRVVADPGVVVEGVAEHELTSSVASLLYLLLSTYPGVASYLVPPLTLQEKVRLINDFEPHLALEVHFNWSKRHTGDTEVLYFPTSAMGKTFAEVFLGDLCRDLGTASRGIKGRSDLFFLKGTKVPSIIVEPVFLSDDKHRHELVHGFLRQEIAFSLARTIAKIAEGWEVS